MEPEKTRAPRRRILMRRCVGEEVEDWDYGGRAGDGGRGWLAREEVARARAELGGW